MQTIIRHIEKKTKRFSKLLSKLMVVFAVIFVLMGIIFESGFFLPAMGLALLYYGYTLFLVSGYEYTFEQETFSIDVIKGKSRRKTEQVLYYKNLEVVAPPDHEAVARYKKQGGEEQLPKFDYTSYQDGVPYYTVIVWRNNEKIKLLMDLDQELLRFMKMKYPTKVFMS